jgi:hypothetical protein
MGWRLHPTRLLSSLWKSWSFRLGSDSLLHCLLPSLSNRSSFPGTTRIPHTPVELKNDWLDKVGSFWLVTCAFGPLFGWLLTSAFSLTVDNWRWFYGGRVALAVGLPIVTALALLRYVRGKGAPLMLALLIGVTALPVWSAWATMMDLRNGPVRSEQINLLLPHTERVLEDR